MAARTADQTGFLAAYDALLDRWGVPVELIDLPSVYGTTRVNVCGPADGRPLVLLHADDATAAVWFANVADLSRERRVYAVDRIGEAGRSVPGEHGVRTAEDALGWLDRVLDGLGLPLTDLCGHSFGGWLALNYALRAPYRVRRLALLDPTACFAKFKAGYLMDAMPMLTRPTAERARELVRRESRGAHVDPQWLELYGLAAEFPRTKPITGRLPTRSALRHLNVPTLVVLAENSRVHNVRQLQVGAQISLPDVETAMLHGVSHHTMPFTHAAELNALLLDFLARP